MSYLKDADKEIYEAIYKETERQHGNIELIASENFAPQAVLEAQGSVLTNKYAEGYPGRRWYGGCDHVDEVEDIAIERAKKLFAADHANVQPHSGTQANMSVYFSMLNPGDTVMAMDLACGGHLSHGHPHNFSGRYFNIVPYTVSKVDERLDFNEILDLAKKHKPKMIIAGACAYSREIDFKEFKEVSSRVGAFLLVDMAHIAGLVATGLHKSPIDYAEFVTTTTHKTLRGPRGGMVLCKREFSSAIDSEIFPGLQGGPLMHVIAAKAVAFKLAMKPEFKEYQKKVLENAKILSIEFMKKGYKVISSGTDNHLFLMDLTPQNITGKDASAALDKARITVNKNLMPFDQKPPSVTSGIRIGSPAVTSRGMGKDEMVRIVRLIDKALKCNNNGPALKEVRQEVGELAEEFPLYKEEREEMRKELGKK